MTAAITDIGERIIAVQAQDAEVITSGAGNDGVEVDGSTIDRLAFSDRAQSGCFLVPLKAVMATTETCTVATQIQDSADGSSWADYPNDTEGEGKKTVVFGGATGAQDIDKCHKHDIPQLGMARRYVRMQSTITLSRGSVDTCAYGGAAVFAGMQELPATSGQET